VGMKTRGRFFLFLVVSFGNAIEQLLHERRILLAPSGRRIHGDWNVVEQI
jgi:hypothetical protein